MRERISKGAGASRSGSVADLSGAPPGVTQPASGGELPTEYLDCAELFNGIGGFGGGEQGERNGIPPENEGGELSTDGASESQSSFGCSELPTASYASPCCVQRIHPSVSRLGLPLLAGLEHVLVSDPELAPLAAEVVQRGDERVRVPSDGGS